MGDYKRFRYGNILAKNKVLLFGDDLIVARKLGKVLKNRGSIFKRLKNIEDFEKNIREFSPQLILIDFNSFSDNLKLCRLIKQTIRISHTPVIILGRETNKNRNIIKSLSAGAEDYILKPLDIELFLAKVGVVLRRRVFQEEPEEILKSKNISLNLTAHTVFVNNKPVKLTPMEFALLYFLMKRKGRVLSKRTLIENVWEHKYFQDMRTVNVHVQNLRKKLGYAGKNIEAVEGIGYKFK